MKKCYEAALPLGANQIFLNQQPPQHQFATSFLFLGWAKETPWFVEVSADGQLNWHTEASFYAIGSGGPFATVAQGLMRHYWEGAPRPVVDGRLVSFRAIATTIDVSSGLVGYPVCMAEVTLAGARVLNATDVDEVATSVDRWKELERESLDRLRVGNLEDRPEELPIVHEASGP